MTAGDQALLKEVLNKTVLTLRGRELAVLPTYYPTKNKACILSLEKRQYVYRYNGYAVGLTELGWQVLGLTPESHFLQEALDDYTQMVQAEQASRQSDRPSLSNNTIEWYREAYKNSEMSSEAVWQMERQRVFDNALISEYMLQEKEQYLAYLCTIFS